MKIVVTRPTGQEEPLVSLLAQLGHEVEHCPLIAIESLGDDPVDVAGYDWVVVTSVNGARELRRRARGPMPRVAAIGPATAEAFGSRVDLVASVSTQEGLLAELPQPVGRVLFAAAEGARSVLPDALEADVVVLYRARPLRPVLPRADLYVLTSASAARALGQLRPGGSVVSIGPETSRAAAEAGLVVVAEATEHSTEGLVTAVAGLRPTG